MKNKKCTKCNSDMFIDEWAGWVWTCKKCKHEEDEPATYDEIIDNMNEKANKTYKNGG